MSKLTGKSLNN